MSDKVTYAGNKHIPRGVTRDVHETSARPEGHIDAGPQGVAEMAVYSGGMMQGEMSAKGREGGKGGDGGGGLWVWVMALRGAGPLQGVVCGAPAKRQHMVLRSPWRCTSCGIEDEVEEEEAMCLKKLVSADDLIGS
jgi:hypothetical protein